MAELSYLEFQQLLIHYYLQNMLFLQTESYSIRTGKQKKKEFTNNLTQKRRANVLKNKLFKSKFKLLSPEPTQNDFLNLSRYKQNDISDDETIVSAEDKLSLTKFESLPLLKIEKDNDSILRNDGLMKFDYFPLPIVQTNGKLIFINLSIPILQQDTNGIGQNITNKSFILTPFHDLYQFYKQKQYITNGYVIIRHDTKTLKLTNHYLLSTENPIETIILKYEATHNFNLIETENTVIPLNQLPNWRILILYQNQIKQRQLKLINFSKFLTKNNTIHIILNDRSILMFDLNSGLLTIPFHNTCMHRTDFHKIEYDKFSKMLCFKMLFLEEITVFVKQINYDCIRFIDTVNDWNNDTFNFFSKKNMYIHKEIIYNDVILYANKIKYNDDKSQSILILYYDRFEIYKKIHKHKVRTYLNNNFDLKYKLILSAKWYDVCFPEKNHFVDKDKTDWFLLCISYIIRDGIEVVKNPKFIKFSSETILEKQLWFKYIHYLKIII